jgi:tetratricopeptide (TPR) repeat protein
MLFRYISFLLLSLIPIASHIQTTSSLPVGNEGHLLSAILSVKAGDRSAASALLEDHTDLITPHLCDRLIQAATMSSALGNSARSLFLLETAKEAAQHLGDVRLLASVFYKIGRAHFDRDDIKPAMEAYLQSKKLFEEVKSPTDLVYVLSELGALHIYAADYRKAQEYSEESLALAASLKDSYSEVNTRNLYPFSDTHLSQAYGISPSRGQYDALLFISAIYRRLSVFCTSPIQN